MDTVAAELMEWGEPSLEDQEVPDRGTRSEERRFPDSRTGWVFQGTTPIASERSRRLRRALAATPKGDPLRRISP